VRWSEGDEPDPTLRQAIGSLPTDWSRSGCLNVWAGKQTARRPHKFNLGPLSDYRLDRPRRDGAGLQGAARSDGTCRGDQGVAARTNRRPKQSPTSLGKSVRLASLDHPKLVAALDAGQERKTSTFWSPNTCGHGPAKNSFGRAGRLASRPPLRSSRRWPRAWSMPTPRESSTATCRRETCWSLRMEKRKLSDLGFAGSLEGSSESDPRHGKIVGTADFLSPDQIHDPWNPAPAWDIYSLGCTLYLRGDGQGAVSRRHDGGKKARAHCEVAAVGSAAAELPAQRRVCRGHGRHDGERAVAANRHGARGSGEDWRPS